MSERYLQSLAILLAGLFSSERTRSERFSLGQSPPSAKEGPGNAVSERGTEHGAEAGTENEH
jgi:hypothetical protein